MANSSVKAKVEALIGVIGENDTTVVSEWASDTAREVINILPEDMLWSVSTELNDSGGGSNASVSISVNSGVITSASVTAGGSGYVSDPIISVSSEDGSGALIRAFSNGSSIIAVDVVSGGANYNGSDAVTVSSGYGVDVSTSKFLYAHKDGYEAIEIPASMKGRASDAGSIYKATSGNPVYYRESGKVTILPNGGRVAVVSFPTILYGDSDVTGVPDDVKHLVIMGTAVKGRLNQLNDLRTSIKDISNPTYLIPNMTFDSSPNIADLVISANVPSLTLSAAPSIVSLDIEAIPPTAPASPSFIYSDVSDSKTIGSTTIIEPSLPSPYVSPTMTINSFPILSWNINALPVCPYYSWDTINEVLASMVMPNGVVLPSISISEPPSLTWDMPATPIAPNVSEKAIADFSSSYPSYNPPVMENLDWEDTNSWITAEEDNEMLAARVQEIQAKIQEYSVRLQDSQALFNKDNAIFQAVVQEKTQEAQLADSNEGRAIQLYQAEVQKYTSVINAKIQENQSRIQVWQNEWSTKVQAYQADVSAIIQKYQAEIAGENQVSQAKVAIRSNQLQEDISKNNASLQTFQAEVTSFQANVASVTQINQGKIAAWQSEIQTNLQKYTTDIQNSLNNFNSSNVEFQASVQYAMENAKMKQDRIVSELQIQQDASKQNALQKLQKEVQEYTNTLNKYSSEVQGYQAKVSTEIQEWTTNNLQHSLAKWNTERSTEIQKYSTDLEKFKAESQNEQQIYAINEIQKEIQLYSSNQSNKLGKFQSDIQNSTQQFQSEFGIYTKKTDSEFQKHQTMMQELQLLQQQYQQGLQMFIQSYTTPQGVEENGK
tara:strand:- start:8139 stop:10631 length:2493 start_codon:yes stop_codon:yes gene_type:complete